MLNEKPRNEDMQPDILVDALDGSSIVRVSESYKVTRAVRG